MRGQAVGKGPSGMAWGMGPPAGRHGGAGVASRLARGQPVGGLTGGSWMPWTYTP